MVTPGAQLDAMVDMMEAFGPPLAQIESVRSELMAQREQLEAMTAELDRLETTVDRLATAAEQLAATQDVFVRMARTVTGGDARARRGRTRQDGPSTGPGSDPEGESS
jgi:hypothetical protein